MAAAMVIGEYERRGEKSCCRESAS